MNKKLHKHMEDAARAHSNLSTFAAVEALLEGGVVYGDVPAARRIIEICKKEAQRQLRLYDAAIAAAHKAAAPSSAAGKEGGE